MGAGEGGAAERARVATDLMKQERKGQKERGRLRLDLQKGRALQ